MEGFHSLDLLLKLLLIVLLVLANGFFVASEFALVAVRRSWVETQATKGDPRARVLLRLLNKLDDYVAATQLGITIASLALGWLGEPALAAWIRPLFDGLPSKVFASVATHSAAIALAFCIITYLHVVVGELAPKTLALERTQQVALAIARPMEIFHHVFLPFVRLLNRSALWVVRFFTIQPPRGHPAMYAEEIQQIINVSHEHGLLEAQEHQMISNVLNFSDVTVREVMRPRADVTAIEASASVEEAMEVFEESGYSRLPVYRQQFDNIIGILHSKDLLGPLRRSESFKIEQVLRKPFFVPDSAPVDEVLRQMRQKKNHFAVVVDEYGGVEGIVTLEDILEELVGEIHDEHDLEEDQVVVRPDGSILLDGRVTIRELNRRGALHLPESDDYTTVAGFLMAETGKLPLLGDKIIHDGLIFTVERTEGRRITRLRVERVAGRAKEAPPPAESRTKVRAQ